MGLKTSIFQDGWPSRRPRERHVQHVAWTMGTLAMRAMQVDECLSCAHFDHTLDLPATWNWRVGPSCALQA
jgi:hypothetical protein